MVATFKPGAQHAMGDNEVRHVGIIESPPHGETVILPYAVHYHGIEIHCMLPQPRHQPGSVSVIEEGWTHSMNLERKTSHMISLRIVKTDNLDGMSPAGQCSGQLPDYLNRTTTFSINGTDDMQYFHGNPAPI